MNEPASRTNVMFSATASSALQRPALHRLAGFLALSAVCLFSAAMFLINWNGDRPRMTGDGYWYMRSTQLYLGNTDAQARESAGKAYCDDNNRAFSHGTRPKFCVEYTTRSVSPRYVAIFENRPGYPGFAAPFVRVLGLAPGYAVATGALAVLVGAAAFGALRASGLSVIAAMVGAGTLAVLPSAFWNSRVQAEGAAMLCLLLTVLAVIRTLNGQRGGPVLAMIALAATFATKSAQGAALSLGLIAFVLIATAGLRGDAFPSRQKGLVVAAIGAAGIGGWLLVSKIFAFPSLVDTVQDYATLHFRRPDIADPMGFLARRAVSMWLRQADNVFGLPWPFIIVLPCCILLVTWLRVVGLVWVAAAASAVAIVTAHPVSGEYDRLIAPVWVAVAAAIAMAVHRVGAWWGERRERPSPENPVPAPRGAA